MKTHYGNNIGSKMSKVTMFVDPHMFAESYPGHTGDNVVETEYVERKPESGDVSNQAYQQPFYNQSAY